MKIHAAMYCSYQENVLEIGNPKKLMQSVILRKEGRTEER
jgi:hypothetical protein